MTKNMLNDDKASAILYNNDKIRTISTSIKHRAQWPSQSQPYFHLYQTRLIAKRSAAAHPTQTTATIHNQTKHISHQSHPNKQTAQPDFDGLLKSKSYRVAPDEFMFDAALLVFISNTPQPSTAICHTIHSHTKRPPEDNNPLQVA